MEIETYSNSFLANKTISEKRNTFKIRNKTRKMEKQ
jgi:hypothetical protein